MEEIKCELVGMLSGGKWDKLHDQSRRVYGVNSLAPTMHTCGGGNLEPKIAEPITEPRIAAMRGRSPDNPSDRTAGSPTQQRLEIGSEETSNTLTTVQKDNLVVEPVWDNDLGCFVNPINGEMLVDDVEHADLPKVNYRIRKLTPTECGRLMGVKSEDCERLAKNQSISSQYHLYGDSIVTTCLMAIFGKLFGVDYESKINELVEDLRQ